MSELVPVLKVVRLPDGRWAAENGEGVGELTQSDLDQIAYAMILWLGVHEQLIQQRN